ncbi:MAG: M1 family metallopeptidase, partial [Bacteroidetes bacterium]|nr:M1 family metallopeptidase [Bacteroidota bacterium]
MMKKILFIASLAMASMPISAQHNDLLCYHADPGRHERNRNVDVIHMKLNVAFQPAQATVLGTVTHQFRCLQDNIDTIFLDAPGIIVDSVWLNGKPITFSYNAAGLICNTNLKQAYNSQHSLKIKYTAKPKKG